MNTVKMTISSIGSRKRRIQQYQRPYHSQLNETSIYGGSFTVNDSSKAVIANGSLANDADRGNLTITEENLRQATTEITPYSDMVKGGMKGRRC